MKKKLAVFPFERSVSALARHCDSLDGYELTFVFVPPSFNYDGLDISHIDGGGETGVTITNYSNEKLSECDAVYIFYSRYLKNLDVYQAVVSVAEQEGKDVIISKDLAEKLGRSCGGDSAQSEYTGRRTLLTINAPVISVYSLGMNCGQCNVEVMLTNYFSREGYKVTTIGSEDYSGLFGYKKIPDYMYSLRDSEEKACMFNRFVKEQTAESRPDLLIIGIPGYAMKYNNQYLNGLGMLPYIVSNAVKGDISVLNLYYNNYMRKEYFNDLKDMFKYRYNNSADYFNVSNTILGRLDGAPDVNFITVDKEFITSHVDFNMEGGDFTLFNSFDDATSREAFGKMELELRSNVQVV